MPIIGLHFTNIFHNYFSMAGKTVTILMELEDLPTFEILKRIMISSHCEKIISGNRVFS